MKKIELFGLNLTFKINKKKYENFETFSSAHYLKEKIFYLFLIITIVVISSRIGYVLDNQKIEIGTVVTQDIYSPKSSSYNDLNKKQQVITDLIENSKKEYISVQQAGPMYISSAELFFDEAISTDSFKNIFFIQNLEDVLGKTIPKNLLSDFSKLSKKNKIKSKD